jgi:5'(3')-deoxyribonucleotidase
MRVGIDLDDVLADFISEFTEVAHEMYGRPEIGTQPMDWEWSNFGLSKEEQGKVWDRITRTWNFWEKLAVEPGADRISMTRLLEDGHDLVFITARAKTAGRTVQEQACRWLDHNFDLEYPTVIVEKDKGPLAAALKLDYFIDDRPKNCIEIQDAVPTCKVFLKNSSHNVGYDSTPGKFFVPFIRVKDFNEFVNKVKVQL